VPKGVGPFRLGNTEKLRGLIDFNFKGGFEKQPVV
jgi:hypothetical protein